MDLAKGERRDTEEVSSVQFPIRGVLMAAGLLLVAAAVLWPVLSRYAGRLPGDFVVRRGSWTFAFPLVTCLVLSLLFSLALWLFRR
ncbi:MAG: DUF2905 domain-containing protein [Acidobacteriota bacterium]|nr:DUF2905 domain-containing protein [Acidobacteriota bacterium]